MKDTDISGGASIESSSREKAESSYTGYELKEMFSAATRWLERNAPAINALNVFPVPDGDTGTNMLLTMRSTMQEAASLQDNNASVISQTMSRGALMGARGNSGVILSQIVKGIAEGLSGAVSFGPGEMTQAFEKASTLAYKAISKPKEGTMLTVIKDVAKAAKQAASANKTDLVHLMEIVVQEAKSSVERTPELLDILKEAGVVDAGGQGLYIILEGILYYLHGDMEKMQLLETKSPAMLQPAFIVARSQRTEEKVYGYCTEFIIKGSELNPDWIRKTLEIKGDSVVVVGDETTVKVHVHTTQPGALLEFGTLWGSLHDLKIQNMDDQNEEFLQMRRAPVPASCAAVVSIVAGKGLENIFSNLGNTAIVPGGQTMNPSTQEILQAIELVPSDKVIVLPNNRNVILAAQQAAKLSSKKVHVLPTRFIPQGVAALLAFNCEMELETNLSEMNKALERVKSIEITKAVRASKVGKLSIKKGDLLGLIDGKITIACDNLWRTVASTIDAASVEKAEIITLYYGADIKEEEAQSLGKALRDQRPDLQVDVVEGSQPHYSYIISVE